MKKKLTLMCLAFLAIAAVAVNSTKRAAETTWVVTTSISVDDVVVFTNVTAQKELKAIEMFGSNSVGSSEDYSGTAPAALYPLTIVAGSAEGSVAFKTSDDKYLAWTTGNTLIAADAVDANSSWNVTFEGEVPTIANVADAARKLQYNSGSPRFATYTSAQKPITIWKQGEAPADAVAKPTISGETPFAEQTTVTLACTTEGAEIFYTTNGSEPTAASTKYTEPFVLTTTATVKAIAIKGDSQSEIASKDFICSTVADLAALNVLPDKTAFTFTGEALVVAKPTAKYVYVRDAKGSSLIYDAKGEKTAAAEVGKTIAANWTGQVSIYNKLFEAVPDANLVMKDGDPVEVSYKTVGLGDVKAENVNMVVALRGVNYTIDEKKNMNITKGDAVAVGYNQFGLEIAAPEEGKTYNMIGAIGRYNDKIQFQPISIEEAIPVDNIEISPESGADIAAALTAAAEGKNVGNITINLAAGGAYTTSASIVAPASVTINGNGATIDASALTAALVTTPAGDLAEWMEGNFTISGVKITGLQKGVYASAGKNYLYNDFKIENSVIELLGTGGCEFDFRKGGVAKNFTIDKSTIYAPIATGNSLYTSQSAQKATEAPGVEVQTFAITNSTLYNLAKGKNFFTHRQANQKWLAYTLTNSLFVNCGKSGQVVKGVNQGQSGANPTWSISGNAFNFEDGEGGFKDTSAEESTGDEAEPVQNSVAGVMAFTSLETPDFGGVFTLGEGATAPESLGDPRWTITYKVMPTNIEISPESGADIAAALTAATEGKNVGNITVNLAEGGAYTISASIVAPASLTINGNGATIDASALTAALVTTPAGDLAEWMEGHFTISGVKITGLQKGVYASAGKNYLYNDFKIENSVIELLGTGGCEFDFRKGGVAKNFTIDKSTIYAPNATGNSLYTSQSAQKATEAPGVEVQTFAITNSTLYNLAKGKNFFTHRQANQKWLAYTLTNSLFVNCGKSGQVVKGVNQGQNGANPTWSINGNAFNFEDGEGGFKDTSADESTGDEAEPVQNSVAGVMAFTSLETPDFGGVFTLGEGATAPESLGDPRWTINYEKDAPAKLYLITGNWDRTNMIDVPFNNETQAYEYETAPEGKMWFAFADKQLTAEEAEADPNWTDFNTNHRYAIGAGDVDASLNEALPLLKIEGTLVLEPVPAGKVYKISVAKDWSTVTITVEVPTGIQSISADKFAEGEWYTIQGVRVEKPAKGIFIHNGRKVVVK